VNTNHHLANLYYHRKEIVDAMEKNGFCSSDAARRQRDLLDFLTAREEFKIKNAASRYEGEWSKVLSSTPLNFVGFVILLAALFSLGFHAEWIPAILLGILIAAVAYKIDKIDEIRVHSRRLLELGVLSLSHLVAQSESISLNEARRRLEYILYTDIEFDEPLLDRFNSFFYQISYSCAQGNCSGCKGNCADYGSVPSGEKVYLWQRPHDPNVSCLHKCHRERASGPNELNLTF
jgi:hypothetical protein